MSEERSAGVSRLFQKKKYAKEGDAEKKYTHIIQKKNNVGVKIDKTNRRDSMGSFPSLKRLDTFDKAEKRLGKKASEKFIDVRQAQNHLHQRKEKW